MSEPGVVTFTFSTTQNRELPDILGQTMVLPQHWWEGTDAEGKARDIGSSTLESPLGSGPYRLAAFQPGQTLRYELVEDYWGKDHPTQIGHNNIAEMRYEYFLDEAVWFEAFKGDQFDFWSEYTARRWATRASRIPAFVTRGGARPASTSATSRPISPGGASDGEMGRPR